MIVPFLAAVWSARRTYTVRGTFWQCEVGIAVTLYLIGLGCWGIIHRGLGLY